MWADGPWCLVLDDVWAFETPVEHRGQQGLFGIRRSLLRELREVSQ
jgi:hypothetical protein